MPGRSFARVRIYQKTAWGLALVSLSVLMLAIPEPSRAQTPGTEPDPHAHHHASAPAAPPQASPARMPAPAHSTAIATPSWFAGGEALFVPPYFDSFKGIDLTALSASQKEHFLHRVNTEFCSCDQTGCRRDTIAHCYVTDSACPRAPVRIREIYEKARSEGEAGGGTAAQPSVTITPRP